MACFVATPCVCFWCSLDCCNGFEMHAPGADGATTDMLWDRARYCAFDRCGFDLPLSRNCTWRLQEAPKTFYASERSMNVSQVMKQHVQEFLPAEGFTRVEDHTRALFIMTGGQFRPVTRGPRLCRQQLVQGMPFEPDKWLDYAALQRLGTRCPWTHVKEFLPLTYALGQAGSCEAWSETVADQYKHGPSAPQNRKTPAWVLKNPRSHLGRSIKFLSWDFAKTRNITKICERHRGYIVQQMIHSTTAFRGGSVFSLRVYFLVTSFSPMKVVWHKTRAAFQLFADRPGEGNITNEGKYLTNLHARAKAKGSKTVVGLDLREYTGVAATAFDELQAGMWEECIVPQLKVALVAYVLHMLLTPSQRASNLFNLFGCDFLVDESFKVRFLESNKWPGCAHILPSLERHVYHCLL